MRLMTHASGWVQPAMNPRAVRSGLMWMHVSPDGIDSPIPPVKTSVVAAYPGHAAMALLLMPRSAKGHRGPFNCVMSIQQSI